MFRRAVWIIALLLLGLATTVGAAWSFAFTHLIDDGDRAFRRVHGDGPLPEGSYPAFDARSAGCLFVTRYARPGSARWDSWAFSRDWQPIMGEPAPNALRIQPGRTPEDLTPAWLHAHVFPWVNGADTWPGEDGLRSDDRRTAQALGWPLLALWCHSRTSGYADQVEGGWDLSPRTRLVGGGMFMWPEPVRLPYRPVWLGLIVNTLLFAGAWAMLLAIPGALRRRLRRRGGRCVKCGYDLKGLPNGALCPECGTTRP